MNRLPRVVITIFVLIAVTINTNIVPVYAATIWIVTNLSDSGSGSLRHAVENSLEGDTVIFDSSLSGQTIITSGITINHDLKVDGSGLTSQITISGNDLYRVLNISSGITVTLDSLIIAHGKAPYGSMGGGILNAGALTIANSTVSESNASYGGGIFNQAGTITLINTTISKNNASMHGGGIKSEGGIVTLSNVTFSNNKTSNTGGAVYNQNGSITVSNSTFSDNIGDPLMQSYAGGIYNNGILNINDSTFSNNSARASGGAIIHAGGTQTITNSIFSGNSTGDHYGSGGGIENNATLTITNSSFSNNIAQSGGAIYNNGTLGILTVTDSTFSGNSAQDGSGIFNYNTLEVTNCSFSGNGTSSYSSSYGGGISNYDTATITDSAFLENFAYNGGGIHNWDSLTVKNSTFYENEAAWGGGLYSFIDLYNNASVTITNSVFAGNSVIDTGLSGGGGGGLYIGSNKTHVIENTTISGNSVSNNTNTSKGGGIYLDQLATLLLNNVTITNNTSQGQGGGIFKDSTAVINLGNSIIAGNNASNHTNNDCSGTLNSLGYNLIQVTTGCTVNGTTTGNITGSTPELAPLGDYGGSTLTHALLPTSPALDAANNASCETQDQRGITRPQDGDNDTTATCDIGSYEHEYNSVAPVVVSILRAAPNPTSAASVNFTVTFDNPVIEVDTNDFELAKTGGITGESVTNVTGSGSTRTVTVNTGSGNGTLRLDVPNTATIKDLSNNDLSGLPFTNGEVYSISKLLPLPTGWVGSVSVTSDKSLVSVGRPHIGSEVASYDGFSSGSTTAFVPMLFKDAFGGSYDAALYIQNVSGSSASVSIQYYDSSGVLNCTKADTIAPLASKGYWLPAATCDTGSLPTGWVGGVKVTSNQNIVAVGRPHIGTEVMTYNGFSSGSTSAFIPMLFKGAFGGSYNAAFYVQNVSGSSASVTLEYFDNTGTLNCTKSDTIASLASKGYWVPAATCDTGSLPAGWVGGVRVSSSQPVVTVGRPHIDTQITTYDGFSAGANSAFVPMLFKGAFGGSYNAAFYLQNVSNSSASVTIKYYDNAGTLNCTKADTIAPLASKGYWVPAATCDTGSLPAGWVGGVEVTSDQPVVSVGRPHIDAQVTTYNGFTAGATDVFLPMLFKDAFGGSYDSAFYLQNTEATAATVTIRFYDSTGVLTCSRSDTIQPRATLGFWVPSATCFP